MSPEKNDPPLDPSEVTPTPPAPVTEEKPPAPTVVDDAGTRALAEALSSSFRILKFLMVALVLLFFASGIFTVAPNEVVVKLRFGKPVGIGQERLLQPGLHWKLPYPVDEIVRIAVVESRTISSSTGWYYVTPEQDAAGIKPMALPYLRPGVDGYTLTRDGNIVHVKASLSYQVIDPIRFTFDFDNATNLLQNILDNALVYSSTRFTAGEAIYAKKLQFQEMVMERVRAGIEEIDLGASVEPRDVNAAPPLFVEAAFAQVLNSQQQRDIQIQNAYSYARTATNQALGEASVVVQNGITSSNSLVVNISAEADRFRGLRAGYDRNPELLRKRLLSETMERVMTNADFKTFLPSRADGRSRELRLLLNKQIEIPKTKARSSTDAASN